MGEVLPQNWPLKKLLMGIPNFSNNAKIAKNALEIAPKQFFGRCGFCKPWPLETHLNQMAVTNFPNETEIDMTHTKWPKTIVRDVCFCRPLPLENHNGNAQFLRQGQHCCDRSEMYRVMQVWVQGY